MYSFKTSNPWRMKNKQIVIISELYYPEQNATGYFLTGIAEGLAADNFNVSVLCAQPTYNQRGVNAPAREIRNQVSIRRCCATTFDPKNIIGRAINFLVVSLSIGIRALMEIKKGQAVLVVTNPPLLPFIVQLICRLKGAKFILLIHDIYPDVLVPLALMKKSGFLYKLISLANSYLYRLSDTVITLGRDMADLVQNKCANKGTIKIIENWADTELIRPIDKEHSKCIEAFGLSNKFIVQYSGNHGRTHDLISLAKAAEALNDYEDIIFLFVGGGSGKKALVDYAKNRNLRNIIFREYAPLSELNDSLNAADLFIISFKEGMSGISVPSRIYNLMATGKPIIGAVEEHSEVAQIIKEEQIGVIVPPGSSEILAQQILLLREDSVARIEMGQRASTCAELKYSYKAIKEKYRLLFEDMFV